MNTFKLSFTDNTTWTGIDAEGFYAEALLTGNTKSMLTLIPNAKDKIKLAQLDLGDILQDADCTFSSTGEGALSQKSFSVTPIKINLEYCQRTFETNYLSQTLRPGSNGAEVLPQSVEQFLMARVGQKVSADTERLLFRGDTVSGSGFLALYDGLEKQLAGDGTVIPVGAVGNITDPNDVIAELNSIYAAIPSELLMKEDAVLFISPATQRAYRQALANASNETYYMQKYNELWFLDLKMVVAPGISDNKAIFSHKGNLLFLTDLISDFEDIQILPQKNVTGVPVVRMIGEFKFGCGYIFGSEVVYYS